MVTPLYRRGLGLSFAGCGTGILAGGSIAVLVITLTDVKPLAYCTAHTSAASRVSVLAVDSYCERAILRQLKLIG